MRIPSFLLGVLFCLFLVVPVMTQQEERIVIGVPLQIGMSKDAVMSRIAERGLHVTEGAGAESWVVSEKNDRNEYDLLGTLYFDASRLSGASRRWTTSTDAEAAKLVRNFYFVLKSFEDGGNTSCTIGTNNTENPEWDSKALLLHCGKRTAVLAVAAYKDQRPVASLD